jgi:hypothetical protein
MPARYLRVHTPVRPNIQVLKSRNVYLRPFDAAQARETFVRLCQKHIMVDHLDSVDSTTHVANKDQRITLFLVGETHKPHTKCKAILDMFQELIAENSALEKPLVIDLIVEMLESEIPSILANDEFSQPDKFQISNIRKFFVKCIQTRDCPVRVHWADPSRTERVMPEWLYILNQVAKPSSSSWYKDNPILRKFMRHEGELPKLLTENTMVVKEIEKASEVNPTYSLRFVKAVFKRMSSEIHPVWQQRVFTLSRAVMDFYTIARIIKLNMSHVIFYGGDNHMDRVLYILNYMGFDILARQEKSGECVSEE